MPCQFSQWVLAFHTLVSHKRTVLHGLQCYQGYRGQDTLQPTVRDLLSRKEFKKIALIFWWDDLVCMACTRTFLCLLGFSSTTADSTLSPSEQQQLYLLLKAQSFVLVQLIQCVDL